MYKVLHNLAPQSLNCFTYLSDVHSRSTRSSSSNVFYLPAHKTNIFRHSFTYQGAFTWNLLPNDVRNSTSLLAFKKSAKKFYMHM